MAKEEKLTVTHPEYGHVVFTGMTTRQTEILKTYQKCLFSEKIVPNNKEFGSVVRKILTPKKVVL